MGEMMVGPPSARREGFRVHTAEPHPKTVGCDVEPLCTPCPPIDPLENPVAVSADSPRASALDEAKQLITGDRNAQYGPPTQDFKRAADALTAFGYRRVDHEGEHPIMSSDVAIIVMQVKTSRLMHSRGKRDSWVDLAGYAGCGFECAVEEADNGS